MLTTGDKILIGVLLILNIFAFIFITGNSFIYAASNTAIIQENGKTIEKVVFENDEELREIQFSFKDQVGVLEIQNGKVRMREMDKAICPEGICSNTGWISKPYESIICLPNKIVVSVETKASNELDFITR